MFPLSKTLSPDSLSLPVNLALAEPKMTEFQPSSGGNDRICTVVAVVVINPFAD